jgi:prolyl-tRNA synthetase
MKSVLTSYVLIESLQLIRLADRKEEQFCLAPTHEEVVTHIVANDVASYRHLPLRLYQIGIKCGI